MTLEFRPPSDLVNAYLNRPSPGQQASDSINQALQSYVALKQQQQQQASLDSQRKASEFKAIADYLPPDQIASVAKQYGINFPTANASTLPQQGQQMPVDAQGNPIGGPVQGPALPGVGMGMAAEQTPQSGMGAPSPLIAAWKQFIAQGNQGNAQGKSKAELARYKDELWTQKLEQDLAKDPNAPVPIMSKSDALDAGTVDPRTKIVEPRDNSVQDNKREDRLARAVTDYGKQIENHPVIKALNNQQIGLDQVNEMTGLVDNGNTVASSAMGVKMARAMGEVGVLTETDIKRYVQSGKLTQGAADKLSSWLTGTPTDATLAEIKQIAVTLKDSFAGKIQPIYDRHIDRFARAYHIEPEEASYRLAIPYSGGKLKTGKETPNPQTGPYTDAQKESRYQAWKAKQAKP